jgi:hypothetical protein
MTTSKSNAAYDTLISLHDNKLKDQLGRIFTVTKTHHYEQG